MTHGKVIVRGYPKKSGQISGLHGETIRITIKNDTEEKEEILFQGIIQSVHIFGENGLNQVIVTAATYDIELDLQEYSRSYQNISDTYIKIMERAVGCRGEILCGLPPMKVGYPVIQYKETDWQFCKRLASAIGLGVFCNPTSPHPQLRIGLTESERNASFNLNQYKACIDESYYYLKEGSGEKREFLYYEVESEENYEIGTINDYKGGKRYIFEQTVELVNNILIFRYKLGGACWFRKAKYYNVKIAGVSLSGKIERTEKQSVYIRLDIDGENAKASYGYPWTPLTGNFMYCMPQVGTRVCLYFPDSDEKNAAAVNCIHTNNSHPGFSTPQNRSFVTEHGKEMQLYPDSICFATGQSDSGQKYRMGKEGFMFQGGVGKVELTGKGKITFWAPEIHVNAAQKIGQYKMENYAVEKESGMFPKGSRNPATGGDSVYEQESGINALAAQGVLFGTVYETYHVFNDAPDYEEDAGGLPTWQKVAAGVALAAVVGLAVGALVVATGGFGLAAVLGGAPSIVGVVAGGITAGVGIAAVAATAKNGGAESALEEYLYNSLSASVRVGGSISAMLLSPKAALQLASLAKMTLGINVGTNILGGLNLVTGTITAANMAFELNDITMFWNEGKPLGASTGNAAYDTLKAVAENGAAFVDLLGSAYIATNGLDPNQTGSIPGNIKKAASYQNTAGNLKAPDTVNFDSKQLGKKWGKHKIDYPDMKNYTDYQNYANNIFNKPDQIIYDAVNGEYFYVKGDDLLRVDKGGEFISLYPGVQSGRVMDAIKNGGTIWP